MKNRNKKVLFALMLGCSITLMATGCDKLKKEPETETEVFDYKETGAATTGLGALLKGIKLN